MSHELWLLRHGQSTGNQQGLRQGRHDFPLSAAGRRQARALATRWRSNNPGFDAVVTSPLERAAQTANIVAEALRCQPEPDPKWVERDAGRASGSPFAPDSGQLATFHQGMAHHSPDPEAESRIALHLRAGQAVQSLLSRPPGRYLVVAHGGLLAAAIRSLLGIFPSARAVLPGFRLDNTGLAIARLDPSRGHWVLERLNDTRHLQE